MTREEHMSNADDVSNVNVVPVPHRALVLPDSVRAYLLHLVLHIIEDDPERDFCGTFYNFVLSDAYYNEDADHATPTFENSDIAAVNQVPRGVCATRRSSIVAPLHWKWPADDALSRDDYVRAIVRRAFYARYIRHVSFSKRSKLWPALAKFYD